MAEDSNGSLSQRSQSGEWAASQVYIWGSVGIGFILAATGLIAGLHIALKRKMAQCPELSPSDRCFVHPHAANGIVVVALSLILAIVIGLLGVIASSVVRGAAGTEELGERP